MRKSVLVVMALAAVSGSAMAGMTVGVTAGADKATTQTKDLMGTGTSTTLGSNGYKMGYGVVLGYEKKLSTNVVGGIDLAYQDSLGSLDTTTTTGVGSSTGKIEAHKSISAKLGYMLAPTTTVYGRLGKGNADFKYTPTGGQNATINFDTTVAGIGIEHNFMHNMSVSGEYRNIYGSINDNDVTSAGLEVGLNYHF
jgi:hypothetical protein